MDEKIPTVDLLEVRQGDEFTAETLVELSNGKGPDAPEEKAEEVES